MFVSLLAFEAETFGLFAAVLILFRAIFVIVLLLLVLLLSWLFYLVIEVLFCYACRQCACVCVCLNSPGFLAPAVAISMENNEPEFVVVDFLFL